MGAKRPAEEEVSSEVSFKQPKESEYEIRLGSDTEDFPSLATVLKADSPSEAKSSFCASQIDRRIENIYMDDAPGPSSFVTNRSKRDDAGDDDIFLAYFPEYMPSRPPRQYENAYTYFLTTAPRKEVPVGPDHQAEIPEWDPNARTDDASGSCKSDDDPMKLKYMGACIVPMPELNDSCTGAAQGCGRTNCSCQDEGSTRCMQQHVKEARDRLRETLGEEIFGRFGFDDIGEEVASKWTAEEERVFQETIFDNPPAQGRNFWNCLGAVFPTRETKELVCYYFNVFMLRRRAVQNRSYYRHIDSDDEYGLGVNYCRKTSLLALNARGGGERKHVPFYEVEEEDDSIIESLVDPDLDVGLFNERGLEEDVQSGDEGYNGTLNGKNAGGDGGNDLNLGACDGTASEQGTTEIEGDKDSSPNDDGR